MTQPAWTRWSLAVLALGLLALGCARGSGTVSPGAVTAAPESASMPLRPEGATVIEQLQTDLDGDGAEEQVSIDQLGDRLGVSIAPAADPEKGWRAELPGDLMSVSSRDVDADRLPEVLIETTGPEPDWYNLCVIRWTGTQGRFLSPKGGPLDGQLCFRSHYYPVLIEDMTGDTTGEIMLASDSSNPQFLDTLVYEWSADAFVKSNEYLMPPRIVPTPAPAPTSN